MELNRLQELLAEFLRENEIPAEASWPEGRKKLICEPVVLVSLSKVECTPVAMRDYLGQQLDEKSGQWMELYGRRAKLDFKLDILAGPQTGAQACRRLFDQMVEVLHSKRPRELAVRTLTGEEIAYDDKENLLRLGCTVRCEGWLWLSDEQPEEILTFTLRGDMKT